MDFPLPWSDMQGLILVLKIDYLIVGSGLTGAVIARTLAEAGREVLVVDRICDYQVNDQRSLS
jgi:glycerol-3-phosphate dehydrogenase